MGSVYGKRMIGTQKTRLSNNINEICRITMVEIEREALERTQCRRPVQRATAVRKRTCCSMVFTVLKKLT